MQTVRQSPFQIAVCGSAGGLISGKISKDAYEIGKAIAISKNILFTGATLGYSLNAVHGVRDHSGLSVGISPAENSVDQQQRFEKIDSQLWTILIYTGVGYKMRDIVMLRSVDAAIFIGGGIGTLLEITVAIDLHRVMGVLEGSGGATDLQAQIAKISHRVKPEFICDSDPKQLVNKIIKILERRKE